MSDFSVGKGGMGMDGTWMRLYLVGALEHDWIIFHFNPFHNMGCHPSH